MVKTNWPRVTGAFPPLGRRFRLPAPLCSHRAWHRLPSSCSSVLSLLFSHGYPSVREIQFYVHHRCLLGTCIHRGHLLFARHCMRFWDVRISKTLALPLWHFLTCHEDGKTDNLELCPGQRPHHAWCGQMGYPGKLCHPHPPVETL